MESNSEKNRIHMSEAAAELVSKQAPDMLLEPRKAITVKGKGKMQTYFLIADDIDHHGSSDTAALFEQKIKRERRAEAGADDEEEQEEGAEEKQENKEEGAGDQEQQAKAKKDSSNDNSDGAAKEKTANKKDDKVTQPSTTTTTTTTTTASEAAAAAAISSGNSIKGKGDAAAAAAGQTKGQRSTSLLTSGSGSSSGGGGGADRTMSASRSSSSSSLNTQGAGSNVPSSFASPSMARRQGSGRSNSTLEVRQVMRNGVVHRHLAETIVLPEIPPEEQPGYGSRPGSRAGKRGKDKDKSKKDKSKKDKSKKDKKKDKQQKEQKEGGVVGDEDEDELGMDRHVSISNVLQVMYADSVSASEDDEAEDNEEDNAPQTRNDGVKQAEEEEEDVVSVAQDPLARKVAGHSSPTALSRAQSESQLENKPSQRDRSGLTSSNSSGNDGSSGSGSGSGSDDQDGDDANKVQQVLKDVDALRFQRVMQKKQQQHSRVANVNTDGECDVVAVSLTTNEGSMIKVAQVDGGADGEVGDEELEVFEEGIDGEIML